MNTVPDIDKATVSTATRQAKAAVRLQAGMQAGKNLVRYIARKDGPRARWFIVHPRKAGTGGEAARWLGFGRGTSAAPLHATISGI